MMDFGKDGLTLPIDPTIKVYGVVPEKCFVFKSAVQPMKMEFNARIFSKDGHATGEMPELTKFSIVFKNGDDTR